MFLIVLLFHSCAGYKPVGVNSIFKKNSINSVVIYQTENDSSYYNVAHYFSSSIIKGLAEVTDLTIKNELDGSINESVLSTRLISSLDPSDAVTTEAMKFIDKSTGYESSIGARDGFYINYQLGYALALEVVLIKNPKRGADIKKVAPKVLFKRIFPVSFKLNNVAFTGGGADSQGATNFVMNESLREKAFEIAALEVADKVRRSFEN